MKWRGIIGCLSRQRVKGGRYVYEQGHVVMTPSWIMRQACPPAALPSRPQKRIINNAIRKIYTTNRFFSEPPRVLTGRQIFQTSIDPGPGM